MEEIQIVKRGNPDWKLIEKIKKDAESETNNLMYLLAEYIESYGAIRADVLEYLAEHPFHPINSLSIINEVKKLMQVKISPFWLETVQDILKSREKDAILLLKELERAVSADLPWEVFREGLETEKTPYELHLFLEERIHGFLKSIEDKEQKQIKQLNYLVDSLNQYQMKIEDLLENMEEILKKQEEVMLSNVPLMEAQIEKQTSDLHLQEEIVSDSEEDEDPEEMYFDETLLPLMEFEKADNMPDSEEGAEIGNDISVDSAFSGEELVPELDDIPEISTQDNFLEEFMPEMDVPRQDNGEGKNLLVEDSEKKEVAGLKMQEGAGKTSIKEESSIVGDSPSLAVYEENYNNQEESGKRYKRLMALATRMLVLEKHRFLNKPSQEQREFLIKKLLDKKAEISKINVLKNLFGAFSNEYLYDLVIRDATEAELRNLLVLQNN